MMLYCRLLGAVLLVCTGFAAGQAYCQRLWAQWRAVCGFERLLTYLADQLAFLRPAQCGAAGRRGGAPGVCRLLPAECCILCGITPTPAAC